MTYNFSPFKTKTAEIEKWLAKEFSGIHTGRATPSILDAVMVESYGSRTSISHVASITVEDARTLRVSPWDKAQTKGIEKAVNEANLGVSASADDQGLRIFFPELTTERRTSLAKVIKQKLEDARVSLRAEREKVWSDIQEKERNGEIPEDDKFRFKEELQKFVDESHKKLDALAERKEKEIMG